MSEAVESTIAKHDPMDSDLFAYGRINNVLVPRKQDIYDTNRYIRVLAMACGPTREVLKLTLLSREISRWNDNRNPILQAYTAYSGEEGFWTGNHGRIHQTTFAEGTKQHQSWLAVRYDDAVIFFKPRVYPDSIIPMNGRNKGLQLPSSRLDANPVLVLQARDLGGASFSYVSFSPWNPCQIVIIDHDGDWSVVHVDFKAKDPVWSVSIASSHAPETPRPETPSQSGDGWARALWAGDSNTLIVATRRRLELFHVRDEARNLDIPDILALAESGDWILDVRRCSDSQDQLFVVTSSRLFWLRVILSEVFVKSNSNSASLQMLLSWVHFRDPSDTSLSLSIVEGRKEEKDMDDFSKYRRPRRNP